MHDAREIRELFAPSLPRPDLISFASRFLSPSDLRLALAYPPLVVAVDRGPEYEACIGGACNVEPPLHRAIEQLGKPGRIPLSCESGEEGEGVECLRACLLPCLDCFRCRGKLREGWGFQAGGRC
jgi:hypothetical protein